MKKPDINSMSLREKIAQTLLIRQSDLLMTPESSYTECRPSDFARRFLAETQPGGVWIHGNVDVNQMNNAYRQNIHFSVESHQNWLLDATQDLEIPPICACDAAGKGAYDGLNSYTTGLIVGAAGSTELAYRLGRGMALEHQAAGSDWIWSPVVDLHDRFSIGIVREFANDQKTASEMAEAYIRGMQSVNVAACAKHFPGADPYENRDSHIVPTVLSMTAEEWKKGQGAVFQAMIDAGVYTIMNTGRAFPAIDDTIVNGHYIQASFSKKILTDLLRGEMGFDGVIITDDVTMGCYTSSYPHDEIYARFLEAGNDVLLGVGIDALPLIEAACQKGIVSEERITDACRRVLDLKEKLGLFERDHRRDLSNLEQITAQTRDVMRAISQSGVTLLRNNNGLLPLKKAPKHVTIFTFTHKPSIYDNIKAMGSAFEKRGATVSLRKRPESFEEIEQAAKDSDLIIYAGYLGFHAPKGAPSFYGDEFWSFRYAFTAGKEKSVGVSLGYPFIHYNFMDDADVFVNLYTPNDYVQEAFVEAVYGEIPFQGSSPLDIDVSKRK